MFNKLIFLAAAAVYATFPVGTKVRVSKACQRAFIVTEVSDDIFEGEALFATEDGVSVGRI